MKETKEYRGKGGEKGQAVVEFALVVGLFILIFVGISDLGRMLYTKHILDKAVREGARAGAVRIDSEEARQTAADVSNQVLETNHISDYSTVNAEIVQVNQYDAIQVSITYSFVPLFRAFFVPVNLNSTAIMRKEG